MNKVILMGRLTRDPEVRYSAGENALAIARYTLAVDRRFRRDGEATADFISCVSFGRTAEFAESKAASDNYAASHPQTSSPAPAPSMPAPGAASADGFMNIPDGIDEELPFI